MIRFYEFLKEHFKGNIDLDTAVIKMGLLKSLTGITGGEATLSQLNLATNEYDGVGYSRMTAPAGAYVWDDANKEINFKLSDVTNFGNLTSANQITGVFIYIHKTDDTDSIPAMIDTNQLPVIMSGGRYEYDNSNPLVKSKFAV